MRAPVEAKNHPLFGACRDISNQKDNDKSKGLAGIRKALFDMHANVIVSQYCCVPQFYHPIVFFLQTLRFSLGRCNMCLITVNAHNRNDSNLRHSPFCLHLTSNIVCPQSSIQQWGYIKQPICKNLWLTEIPNHNGVKRYTEVFEGQVCGGLWSHYALLQEVKTSLDQQGNPNQHEKHISRHSSFCDVRLFSSFPGRPPERYPPSSFYVTNHPS